MTIGNGLELELIKQQIAQLCAFSLGRQKIEELQPSFSPLLIAKENRRIAEALQAVIQFGPMPFYGIRDLSRSLHTVLRDGVCTPQELIQAADHARGVSGAQSYLKSVELPCPEIHELADTMQPHLEVAQQLERCFTPYGEVLDSASAELKQIRRSLHQTEAELVRESQRFVQSHASLLTDSITTTRNGRIVVLAKISEKNSLGGFVHGESASGATAYVEPGCLIELNNRKQTLISREQDEIDRILVDCSRLLKSVAEPYLANLETLAILDALFAKAQWGQRHNGVVAKLSEGRTLILNQARHPLIDPKTVVANTYRIIEPQKMLMITGPNTGGKTVSLKIIGLFVLMSYCGIPICCEEAEIPLFDQVFVDIGDDQSIVQSLSTFSAHLSKLADITGHATKKSLVLLDELGSGTDPKEGESLAIAVLNDLREKGCLSVITTHYGRLKLYGKRHEDILVASVQFDVEKMMPTYHFIEGLSGQSNAFEIARRFGLKEKIIREAEFLKRQQRSQEDELIEKLEAQILQNQQLKEKQEALIAQTEQRQKQLEQELNRLSAEKQKILDTAEKQAQKHLEEIKEEGEALLEELRQSEKTMKLHEIIEKQHQLNALGKSEAQLEEEAAAEPEPQFQVGSFVELKKSSQIAEILQLKRNQAVVDLNGIRTTVKLEDMRPTQRRKNKPAASSTSMKALRAKTVSLECNIIGCHVLDGLEIVDKYLDDAVVARIGSVRIIHGAGTGVLRKAVQDKLNKDRRVESWRIGGAGEGGAGATVVTLKTGKSK